MTTIPDVMAAEDMIRDLCARIDYGNLHADHLTNLAESLVSGITGRNIVGCPSCAERDDHIYNLQERVEFLEGERAETLDALHEARRELAEYHRGEADSARHRL